MGRAGERRPLSERTLRVYLKSENAQYLVRSDTRSYVQHPRRAANTPPAKASDTAEPTSITSSKNGFGVAKGYPPGPISLPSTSRKPIWSTWCLISL